MKAKNTQHLYQNLKRKGIQLDRGDIKYLQNYSYYQIINAYKPLFISNVKNIDDIKTDLVQGSNLDEYGRIFNKETFKNQQWNVFYHEICKRICETYVGNHNNKTTSELEKLIKSKKYLLHLYDPNTKLNDFVRMYQFEHSLRNLLLKYILRIEEDIKNIFCSSLNDSKLDSNFLLDINNYNVSDDESIRTLIKVIKKHHNRHSNPISRKKSQNIIPPFWILINELTLGELMHTISSLKNEYRNIVMDSLVEYFTTVSTPNARDRNAMQNLLSDISGFRNDLAHNNPIFQYNIWGNSLKKHPRMSYIKPKIKNVTQYSHSQIRARQNNRKQQILSDIGRFWGQNQYTMQSVTTFNINLSYILVLLYKFTYSVDSTTNYIDNIKRIFTKYKVINLGSWGTCYDIDKYNQNQEKLKDISKLLNQLKSTPYRSLSSKQEFKAVIAHFKSEISTIKREVSDVMSTNIVVPDDTKDCPFPFLSEYTRYTGIDVNFLTVLLN